MGNVTALVPQSQEQRGLTVPKYSNDQIKLLADTIARGCDENELKLFLEISKFSRLNPFTGQIRPVKRWNSDLGREAMVIQVGIDGYRSIAARTQELAGIEDAVFDSEENPYPQTAKVTVYRWSHGNRIPYTATARWGEYVQRKKDGDPNSMWKRMPYLMLAKCAEALALRKAFPDDLAGIYTEEEMGQADNDEPKTFPTTAAKKPVQQPTRASEKKQEPTQPTITGRIESIKMDQKGRAWLSLDKKIVVFEEKFVDDEVKVDNVFTVKAVKHNRQDIGDYYVATEVLENPKQEEPVLEGEVVTQQSGGVEIPEDVGDLFDSGKVQKASEVQTRVIGPKRAQRLYAMMNQNKQTTGLTEAKVHDLLKRMKKPLEHLSNLEIGLHEMFEKLMTGEVPMADVEKIVC